MQTSDDDDDDDIAEDETEWQSSLTELETHPAAAAAAGSHIDGPPPQETSRRVILHFDLDCFYAQVEMIRNPALRNVPLGIQQKYIIVTCNYVARDQGVTKLMSVADAKVKCPNLVLVKGEDLTHYRETSYKVTELLMSYCPLVERLGFDENFMDITGMVERRLTQTTDSHNASFEGHVYNHASGADKAGDHPRLVLGSHIAAELRAAINTKLGLTGCAGVATNKLLAKLVSGTFKPNQQTTLLPENIGDIMGRLGGLRRVPGVGHQTSKRLRALGLVSVQDLQLFPRAELVREFGSPTAQRLGNLSLGIDGSPVTPSGAPQSLSDEDSFKKMSTTKEVFQKTQDLLSSLVERMHKDGRQPQTFRLTIRRYSATNKWFSRESRQCPIPNYLGQKISSGSSDAVAQLVAMAVKLFHKMVDGGAAFHLTLINVCFANLQSRGPAASGKGAITSFFSHSASPGKSQSSSQDQASPPSVRGRRTDHGFGCDVDSSYLETVITQDNFHKVAAAESAAGAPRHLHGSPTTKGPVVSAAPPDLQRVMCSTGGPESDGRTSEGLEFGCRLPPNVDPDVFRLLPEDIQRELLSPAFTGVQQGPSKPAAGPSRVDTFDSPPPRLYAPQLTPRPSTHSPRLGDTRQAVSDAMNTADNQTSPGPSVAPGQATVEAQGPGARPPRLLSSECDFPMNVDPGVFSELPGDVQRDLMAEWKQQRPVLKTPSCIKQGRNSSAKDKKSAVKGNQRNNLYNYFKPN